MQILTKIGFYITKTKKTPPIVVKQFFVLTVMPKSIF